MNKLPRHATSRCRPASIPIVSRTIYLLSPPWFPRSTQRTFRRPFSLPAFNRHMGWQRRRKSIAQNPPVHHSFERIVFVRSIGKHPRLLLYPFPRQRMGRDLWSTETGRRREQNWTGSFWVSQSVRPIRIRTRGVRAPGRGVDLECLRLKRTPRFLRQPPCRHTAQSLLCYPSSPTLSNSRQVYRPTTPMCPNRRWAPLAWVLLG